MPSTAAAAAAVIVLVAAAAGAAPAAAWQIADANGGNIRPFLDQNSQAVVQNCETTVLIKDGDTCASIAANADIALSKLRSLNTFLDCNNLQANQMLCIATESSGSSNELGDMSLCVANYTIQADDTCEGISTEFDITITQLLTLNEYLDCVNLDAGSSVCVEGYADNSTTLIGGPKSGSSNATNVPVSECASVITVSSSQTCLSLTNLYDISISDLFKWNSNLDCWHLTDGEKVCVHAPSSASATHAAASASSTSSAANSTTASSSSASSTSSSSSAEPTSTTTEDVWTPTTTSTSEEPTTTSQDSGGSSGGGGSDDGSGILDRHNSYRSSYGIPSLSWDSGLASEASSYASYLAYSMGCLLVHSGTSGEGENLAGYGATAGAGSMTEASAVDSWMTEDPNSFDHASQ
ncbi:hypothetical protein HK405_010006, partial [Cladochytrium tenue]